MPGRQEGEPGIVFFFKEDLGISFAIFHPYWGRST
jgi:hypothetical protein